MTRSRRRKLQRLLTRQRIGEGAPLRKPRRAVLMRSAPVLSALLATMPAVHAADETTEGLKEIVVTAQKRTERLQDVPISLQALGTETLEQHQVNNFDDYTKLLPSASFQSFGPGQSQLFFRGISSAGDGGYGVKGLSLPASGVYLDEIPVTTTGSLVDIHAYDIARVEALSGPQGTLFGASSLAGTLRIITNPPDPTHFSAGYDIQGNKFTQGGPGGVFEGFVNLPITDRIAARLVGYYDRDGGYIDNVPSTRTYTLGDDDPTTNFTINNARFAQKNYNTVDTYGGRAALKIDLNDRWTVTPALIYQHQEANGSALWDPKDGYLKTNNFTPESNADRWVQAALTVNGKIGNWDVVYAGGYFDREISAYADYSYYTVAYDQFPGYTNLPDGQGGLIDPTQYVKEGDRMTKATHEVRVSSPQDRPVRGLVGAFHQAQRLNFLASYAIKGLGSVPNDFTIPGLGDDIFATRSHTIDHDDAVFGELSVDLAKNLTLTGGLREFRYNRTRDGFSGFASAIDNPECVPVIGGVIPCTRHRQSDGTGNTHKVNLSWKVDPDRMVYATWSTGFRPGGANGRLGVHPYQPDTLTNYEIGWKTAWLDRSLYFNGALFIEDWSGVQFSLPSVGSNGFIAVYNAGDARSKGAEGTLTWRFDHHYTLSTSATYIDAHLTTNFCAFDVTANPDCSQGIAAPAGTQLPIQPRFKVNATLRYDFNIGSLDSFAQAAMFHQTSTRTWLTDNEADLLGDTSAFTTADFSFGLARDNWTFEAFIQNAFGDHGVLSFNTVCIPSICGFRSRDYSVRPQTVGIKISQRF